MALFLARTCPVRAFFVWLLVFGGERHLAVGVFLLAGGSLPGERLLAVVLFLFGVKKEPKNRHRFDAVDADQGCGPGPGECGHLTTAYSGPGGA